MKFKDFVNSDFPNIASVLIIFFIVGFFIITTPDNPQPKVYNPIKEPLAMNDPAPVVFDGMVFKKDSSQADFLAAGMEMVEVKLDPRKDIFIHYAAAPAPLNMFKIGDRVQWKSVYFRSDDAERIQMTFILRPIDPVKR